MVKEDIINWAKKSMEEIGGKKAVIGISGGKDSTIVAKIFVEALGKENVIGVLMPDGEQKDISDSYKVCELLDIDYLVVNIGDAIKSIYNQINTDFSNHISPFGQRSTYGTKLFGGNLSKVTTTNTPPRIRMTVLYAIAGSISGARVINTSNYSEYYIGWCTKWGDMNGDLYPLLNLTKTEVCQLGDELGLPYDLVHKIPADGLTGKSDEENIGLRYEVLDRYLVRVRGLGYPNGLPPHIEDDEWVKGMYDVTLEQARKIEDMHRKANHKIERGNVFCPPPQIGHNN